MASRSNGLPAVHLHYAQAIDAALETHTGEQFASYFLEDESDDPNLVEMLKNAHKAATKNIRQNAIAELQLIVQEHKLKESFNKLDESKHQAPELHDGSTCLVTRKNEAENMVVAATAPVKQQHKEALSRAIQQVTNFAPRPIFFSSMISNVLLTPPPFSRTNNADGAGEF